MGSSEPARSGIGEFISSVAGRFTVVPRLFLSIFHSLPRHSFSHICLSILLLGHRQMKCESWSF